MEKVDEKTKLASEHKRACCSSRHRFKYKTKMVGWSSRIKNSTLTNHVNTGKYVREIVEINERYVKYFGLVSLPLFPSDMEEEE